MVSSHTGSVMGEDRGTWHDKVIEFGMAVLLVFAPLAFGSVHIWSAAFLQTGSFVLLLVWLKKVSRKSVVVIKGWQVIAPALLFVILVALQLVPLPHVFVKVLSSAAAQIYESAWGPGEIRWHTLSIHPQATLQELLNILAYLSAFIVVVNQWRTKEQIMRLIRVIIAIACFLVVIAFLQKVFWNGRLYWVYPIDQALQSRLHYIWGPYVNRNHFAGYLEMVIPFALAYLLYVVARNRENARFDKQAVILANSNSLPTVVILVLAAAIMISSLFATLSRGAFLGFMASIVLMYFMARSRRTLKSRMMLVLFLSLVMVFAGVIATWDRIEKRFMEIADEDRFERIQVWHDLRNSVADFPLIGSGLGTFDRTFPRYQSQYSMVTFEHAENDYLEILTDTGFLGAGIVVLIVVIFFSTTIKKWNDRHSFFVTNMALGGISSCAAIAVHSLVDFNLRVPANAFLLAVVAGLTYAILDTRRKREGVTGHPSRDGRK